MLALAVAAQSMPLSWSVASPPPAEAADQPLATDCSCCSRTDCPCGCCALPTTPHDPKRSTEAAAEPRPAGTDAPPVLKTAIRCGCSPDRFFLLSLTLFLEPRTETKLPAPPAGILEERRESSATHFRPPDPPPPRRAA